MISLTKIYLGEKAVDHDGVEANDEEERQEITKDKETHLRHVWNNKITLRHIWNKKITRDVEHFERKNSEV